MTAYTTPANYDEVMSGDYPDRARPELVHSKIQYDATVPVAEHVAALAALHHADKKSERLKSMFTTIGCLGFLAGCGTLFFKGLLFEDDATGLVVGFGVLAGTIGLAIVGNLLFGKNDVDDRKLALPSDLLDTLRPELKPARPVHIAIDFRAYDRAAGKRQGSGAFEHPRWLQVELPLLDGTRARLEVSTRVKRKEREKRKYTKVKDKIVDEIRVELRAPRELSPPADVQTRFNVPGMRIKDARVSGRAARFVFECGPAITLSLRASWWWKDIESLVDSQKLLGALVFAYKATAAAGADTTASA
jgi:hypothetical protein